MTQILKPGLTEVNAPTPEQVCRNVFGFEIGALSIHYLLMFSEPCFMQVDPLVGIKRVEMYGRSA